MSLILGLMALPTGIFGAYLIYEKVFLSIATGQIEERAGIILRAAEPFGFWAWVVTYSLAGSLLVLTGLGLLRGMIRYLTK